MAASTQHEMTPVPDISCQGCVTGAPARRARRGRWITFVAGSGFSLRSSGQETFGGSRQATSACDAPAPWLGSTSSSPGIARNRPENRTINLSSARPSSWIPPHRSAFEPIIEPAVAAPRSLGTYRDRARPPQGAGGLSIASPPHSPTPFIPTPSGPASRLPHDVETRPPGPPQAIR
jgi:hypothetical protein